MRIITYYLRPMGSGHNNVNSAYTPSITTRVVYGCGFCKRTRNFVRNLVERSYRLSCVVCVLLRQQSILYVSVYVHWAVWTLFNTYIRHTHVTRLLQQLQWPSVPERVSFKLCVLVYCPWLSTRAILDRTYSAQRFSIFS